MQHTPVTGIHDVIRMTDIIPDSDDRVLRHARSVINKSLFGSLIVEFDFRRVIVSNVRGDAALRFHALVQDRREGDPSSARWADQQDPRYSVADARLVTFEVARVMAVLWEPERLVHGDSARRELLAACIRIVNTSAKHKDPAEWEKQDLTDYGAVVLDMEPVDGSSAADADADSGPEPNDGETDEEPDSDPNDSGAGPAPAEPPLDEGAPRAEGDAPIAVELPDGGGAL